MSEEATNQITEEVIEETTEEITETTPEESNQEEMSEEDKAFHEWMATDEEPEGFEEEEESEDKPKKDEDKKDEKKQEDKVEKDQAEKEEKPTPKVVKLKVNGKEVEHDLSDEAKTTELVQRGLSATETWQEAAKVRKQASELVQSLKTNPRAILESPQLGIDLKALAEEVLLEEYELEGMSEAEREYKLKTRQIEKDKAEQAKQQQIQAQKQQQEKIQQARQALNKNIADSLTSTKMPVNAHTLSQVTQVLKQMHAAGAQPDVQQAVSFVREKHLEEERARFSSLSPDELIDMIGADNYERIREHKLSQIKEQPKPKPKTQSKPKTSKKYKSEAEFLREMAKKSPSW